MRKSTAWLNFLVQLSVIVLLGCNSLEKGNSDPFLKPLDGSEHAASLNGSPNEYELCVETARTVAAKGHAKEAILLYEQAEGLDPNKKRFDRELAPLYVHVGKIDAAIARYRNAIAEGGVSDEVFNNLAWTLSESGRHAEAMETIEQGLETTPESKRLQATVAVLLYKQGDREGSFETFRELYGESAAHHNIALLALESDNIDSAVQHARLAVSFPGCSPESVTLHDTLQKLASKHRVNNVDVVDEATSPSARDS